MALSLSSANLFGYIKCKKDASKKLKSMAGNFLGQQLLKQVRMPRVIMLLKKVWHRIMSEVNMLAGLSFRN